MQAHTDVLALSREPLPAGLNLHDWTLQVVADSSQFRTLLRQARPVLAIVFAPPATGMDVEAVIAERRRRSDMRALLVDRPESIAERIEALRAGFDDALDSRIAPAELAGRVAVLAEQARAAGEKHRIAISRELVLDLDAHELRVRGTAVHLRPREYALLEVLARHPGQTYTREQLLDAVGASETTGERRTVDVHIRWLRAKLEREGDGRPRLITVRGVGYRLDR